MSTRPPTLPDAFEQGLLAPEGAGIYTFSHSDSGIAWMDRNCFECQYYEHDGPAGETCAFEGALLIDIVSPELARLFGWIEDPAETNPRDAFSPPARCALFRGKDEPPIPFDDPDQLAMFAGEVSA